MPHYIVRESFTTITYVEAATEAEALSKHGERSPREFDEMDHDAPYATSVSPDPDKAGEPKPRIRIPARRAA